MKVENVIGTGVEEIRSIRTTSMDKRGSAELLNVEQNNSKNASSDSLNSDSKSSSLNSKMGQESVLHLIIQLTTNFNKNNSSYRIKFHKNLTQFLRRVGKKRPIRKAFPRVLLPQIIILSLLWRQKKTIK